MQISNETSEARTQAAAMATNVPAGELAMAAESWCGLLADAIAEGDAEDMEFYSTALESLIRRRLDAIG